METMDVSEDNQSSNATSFSNNSNIENNNDTAANKTIQNQSFESELNVTEKLVFSDSESDQEIIGKSSVNTTRPSTKLIDTDSDSTHGDTTTINQTAVSTNALINFNSESSDDETSSSKQFKLPHKRIAVASNSSSERMDDSDKDSGNIETKRKNKKLRKKSSHGKLRANKNNEVMILKMILFY